MILTSACVRSRSTQTPKIEVVLASPQVVVSSLQEVRTDPFKVASTHNVLIEAYCGDDHVWSGSGVLLNRDTEGRVYVLSVAHVVENSCSIGQNLKLEMIKELVTGGTEVKYELETGRVDHVHELSILRTKVPAPILKFTPMTLGEEPKLGDEVFSTGTPGGNKRLQDFVVREVVTRVHVHVGSNDVYQTAVSTGILPGMSGGGAYNIRGELVGLNVETLGSAHEIGFIVRVTDIKSFLIRK